MYRKFLSFIVLVSILPTFSHASDPQPEVLGVLFYADWCNSCKVLDPELAKAREESNLDTESVLFVRLDLTDETTSLQSHFLASQLGIGEFYAENAGSTGFLLLVDAETKEVLTRITKTSDADEITNVIRKAIQHSEA